MLFVCRPKCQLGGPPGFDSNNRAFVWTPRQPNVVAEIETRPVPPGGPGTADFFCGGHVSLPDGRVMWVGGTDFASQCLSAAPCVAVDMLPVGHKVAYLLDPLQDPPVWVTQGGWPKLMAREHWYPQAIMLHSANGVLVTGHIGAPNPDCPVPYPAWPPPGYSGAYLDTVREHYDPVLQDFPSIPFENREHVACDASDPLLRVADYPRLHMLGLGVVVHGNALDLAAPPTSPPSVRPLAMNLLQPACPSDPVDDLRWEPLAAAPSSFLSDGVSTVHLYVRDKTDPQQPFRDVVYSAGGTDGHDDDVCEPPIPNVTAAVHRLKDTDGDLDVLDEVWQPMTPMHHARVNHNLVLLPTGEILAVGGQRIVGGDCAFVKTSEAYRPREVFGSATGDQWVVLDDNDRPRLYHSVAGLLRDGRVFAAGGEGPHAYHTVEIYSPPYMFSSSRPSITDWPKPLPPGGSIEHGEDFEISVTLSCSAANSVSRVVLIRSGSITHGFDSGQRYVELDFSIQGSYPDYTVTAVLPVNEYAVPAGFYLLFVVDADGTPSEGRWVKVG